MLLNEQTVSGRVIWTVVVGLAASLIWRVVEQPCFWQALVQAGCHRYWAYVCVMYDAAFLISNLRIIFLANPVSESVK